MDMERWAPVVGYEGLYEVSNHGRIKCLPRPFRPKELITSGCTHHLKRNGKVVYVRKDVVLTKHGVTRVVVLAGVVLEAFVGQRPDGMMALHGDGDPLNNRLDNLRWGTQADNMKDSIRHGTNFVLHKETIVFVVRDGRTMSLVQACEEAGKPYMTAYKRKRRGISDDDLFNYASKSRRR